MKTSCLINSYNYRPYVCEAIQSVLDQTRAVDEIVVVDDGSTDGSFELLQSRWADHERVRLIGQPNAGQLSCFNRGVEEASGELIFFLDADDRYRPGYVERAIKLYESQPYVDFLAVVDAHFGQSAGRRLSVPISRDLGISTLAALLDRKWVGGATSCISMRSTLARRILPCPLEDSWRTRADDVLVFGASIVGAHKYRLGEVLVDYRVHGQNRFTGSRQTAAEVMRHSLAVNQLVSWYANQMGFDRDQLLRIVHREFRTLERPSRKELTSYLGISWRSRAPMSQRLHQMIAILAHACSQHAARPARVAPRWISDGIRQLHPFKRVSRMIPDGAE